MATPARSVPGWRVARRANIKADPVRLELSAERKSHARSARKPSSTNAVHVATAELEGLKASAAETKNDTPRHT
jgi:hypothetical protein